MAQEGQQNKKTTKEKGRLRELYYLLEIYLKLKKLSLSKDSMIPDKLEHLQIAHLQIIASQEKVLQIAQFFFTVLNS